MFGFQVAFCWRNTAIYAGLAIFGLLYGLARDRDIPWLKWLRKPIKLWVFLLFLLPMAVDGFTHMFGLRDMYDNPNMDFWYGLRFINSGSQVFSSNWWLRIVTGLLAALGAVWFAFPRMNRVVQESEAMRLAYLQSTGLPHGAAARSTSPKV